MQADNLYAPEWQLPRNNIRTAQMPRVLVRFLSDESGATAIEYGLIAALVAVVAITGMTTLGTKLKALFTGVAGKLVAPT
jgi:pilus assembly protein Flp/PilA